MRTSTVLSAATVTSLGALLLAVSAASRGDHAVAPVSTPNERAGGLAAPPPRPEFPAEWASWRRLYWADERGRIPADLWMRGKAELDRLPGLDGTVAGLSPNLWRELGPGNIGGRVRAMVFHPSRPGELWIGSVSGGLWRRTFSTGPSTWRKVDDFMGNLGVTSIVFDPASPQTMWVATGEGFGNADAVRGAGIFKSTDGGVRFTRLPSTAGSGFWWVNRLAVSPDGKVLLAATGSRLYRSTDGGTSFTSVAGGANSSFLDVKFHPTDSLVAVANWRDWDFQNSTWFSTCVYTTDGGQSWRESSGMRWNDWFARVELAWHRGYTGSGNGCVYAMQAQSGKVLRSTDGGASFQTTAQSGVGSWYADAVWVDPSDQNQNTGDDVVLIGGVDLHRSTDGGRTFAPISDWAQWPQSAHADHHAIVEDPGFDGASNRRVFFGNDGGVWSTQDVYNVAALSGWLDRNSSLPITQFYGASSNGAGTLIGGTQDAGTLRHTPAQGQNGWTTMFGGDGGACASDPVNRNVHYGEYVRLQIHRSTDGGASAQYVCGQHWNGSSWVWKSAPYVIPDARDGTAAFIAPFAMDPSDPNRLLAGGQSLWRTGDARTQNTATTGPSWASIKAPTASQQDITAIAIAPFTPGLVYVGHGDGEVYRTTNATAASPTWVKMTGIGTSGRIVSRITFDQGDTRHVLVAFGGFTANNLWETKDGGATWRALSSVPQIPLRDVELHPTRSGWLYVASEMGVLVSDDGGQSWAAMNQGPADVAVDELLWDGGELYAVTHGRGIFAQRPTSFGLSLTTSGNGDLRVALSNLPGAAYGLTMFSLDATGPLGGGPFFGLYPDSLTVATFTTPFPLFQWSGPYLQGVWPKAPFQLPAGLFSVLAGRSMDAVAVAFSPAWQLIDESNNARVTF